MTDQTQTPPADDIKPDDASTGASEDTPAGQEEETVTLPKAEAERLQALSDKEDELKGREQKLTRREQRMKKKSDNKKQETASTSSGFTYERPEPSDDDDTRAVEAERLQLRDEREAFAVEKGVSKLLRSGKYDDLLKNSPILADQLNNAPLGLYIFQIERPIDAGDALSRIEDYLEDEIDKAPSSTSKKEEEKSDDEKDDKASPAPSNPPADEDKKKDTDKKSGPFRSKVETVGENLEGRFKGMSQFAGRR